MDSVDQALNRELVTSRETGLLSQALLRSSARLISVAAQSQGESGSAGSPRVDSALADLREAVTSWQGQQLETDARTSLAGVTSLGQQLRALSLDDAVSQTIREEVSDSLFDTVNLFLAAQEGRALERSRLLSETSRRGRIGIWLLFGLALLVGIGSAVSTVMSVVSPLHKLVQATERVGIGDLRPISLGQMPGELAPLGEAVTRTSERLRSVVGSVTEVSSSVARNANQLSTRSDQLSRNADQVSLAIAEVSSGAERQATGTRETDQVLSDLRSAAARSAASGQRVVAVAEAIRRTAATHRELLGTASSTLLELREIIVQTTDSVGRLTQAAAAVSEFVSLTGQLAAQTELLSLNAAIEAARAGDTGEGFAVVAGEIRQLAETSAEGARRIARTVAQLDEQVRQVAQTVAGGAERMTGVEGVAVGVTEALARIVTAVEEVSVAARGVATEAAAHRELADQLAASTAEVARSAEINARASQAVTDSAREQSGATQEIASAATTLVESAEQLNRLVSGFRL